MSYKYYQPANGDQATDDDRYEAMKAAVDGGATVVVCAGFLQEAALKQAAIDYPDTKFIFVDGYPINGDAISLWPTWLALLLRKSSPATLPAMPL